MNAFLSSRLYKRRTRPVVDSMLSLTKETPRLLKLFELPARTMSFPTQEKMEFMSCPFSVYQNVADTSKRQSSELAFSPKTAETTWSSASIREIFLDGSQKASFGELAMDSSFKLQSDDECLQSQPIATDSSVSNRSRRISKGLIWTCARCRNPTMQRTCGWCKLLTKDYLAENCSRSL